MTAVVTRTTDELDDPVWDDALDRALAGEGVRLVAQPIIDVTHARVGGYELLSRLDGPPAASPEPRARDPAHGSVSTRSAGPPSWSA